MPKENTRMRTKDGLRVLITDPTLVEDYEGYEGVRVHGNVAPATHGESVTETIGGADHQAPDAVVIELGLTPGMPTLSLVVAGRPDRPMAVLALAEQVPDTAYCVELKEDGSAVIRFGDGAYGRPPASFQVLCASYRAGGGTAGNVTPGTITILADRPSGVTGVSNPQPASGGADLEQIDEVRQAAPQSFSIQDRAVSASDFEDLARSFPAVRKAEQVRPKSKPAKRKRRIVKISIPAEEED